MLARSGHRETSKTSLGQRRGVSDLARFALDLTWAKERAEPGTAARPRAYPSPPMSGSPPPPPETPQEAGDRGQQQSRYPPTTALHDVYTGGSTTTAAQGSATAQRGPPSQRPSLPPPHPPPTITPQARSFQPEMPGRVTQPYPPSRHDEPGPVPAPYPYTTSYVPQERGAPQYMPVQQGPLPPPPVQTFSASGQQQQTEDSQASSSPKSQRKTKGHVASACVPCKKAHLRCDARRPCSRCLSNGKEDACVDVQHKKRGRPRLRDDRESRFGPPAYSNPQDTAMRRPLSLYASSGSVSGYEDPIRRNHSYRILKSQPREPITPRYIERASSSDANIYGPPPPAAPAPLAIATAVPHPVAFLNSDMEIMRASPTFIDAVGAGNVRGRRFADILAPSERAKVQGHQMMMQEERSRKDPMYLPPIFGRQEEERVFDTLRFDAEELSRIQMDRQDMFVFAGTDGQLRSFAVRLGSAKRDSIYFVALLLQPPQGFSYTTPSPHARDMPFAYHPQAPVLSPQSHAPPHHQHQHQHQQPQHQQHQPQQAYGLPHPASGQYDTDRRRFSEGALAPRGAIGQGTGMLAGISPGVSPGFSPGLAGPSGVQSSYAASPSRVEYSMPAPSGSQIPRSEMSPGGVRPTQSHQHSSFQLPPIRSSPQQQAASRPDNSTRRDDRSSRVDIGGLIEKPEEGSRPQR